MRASSAPSPTPTVSRWAAPLVSSTIIAGAIVLVASFADAFSADAWTALAPYLLLAVLAEWLSVATYSAQGERISLSFGVVVCMAAAAASPHGAALVAVAIALTTAVIQRQWRHQKTLFNMANYALATITASLIYAWLRPPQLDLELPTFLAIVAAVASFHFVNNGLVSLVVSLHAGQSFRSVVQASAWYVPNKLALGLIGGCVGLLHRELGPGGTLLFILPLGILRYTLTMYTRQTRRTIATLERQARTDPLTGLPNRLLLRERLDQALRTIAGEPASTGGLLLLDLDRFKEVNDTFGHYAGDRLLQQVARRLQDGLPRDAIVARLGGDEFAVLVSDATAELLARRLLSLLDQPLIVESQRLQIGASVGIVLYPADGTDADTLLRRADVAMYVAKRRRSGHARYRAADDEHTPARLALLGELRQAIGQAELTLEYQPQLEIATGKVVGVEALVRWPHATRGMIPPTEFIGMAEHTGLIEPLTRYVVRTALRQCRGWLDRGLEMPVSVNVSMHDLYDGFSQLIAEALLAEDVPPGYLQLEITEGTMMADLARAQTVLRELRALGVRISVDDYGTGYSSLAYLSQLPINELKIDRTFIAQMRRSPRHAAIVRSTIALGHDLGLVVVAEGVEDQHEWDMLAEFGCDVLQGYLASRPVAAPAFERWLAAWRSPAAVLLRAA